MWKDIGVCVESMCDEHFPCFEEWTLNIIHNLKSVCMHYAELKYGPILGVPALSLPHIKPEVRDIAILNHILFPFEPLQALLRGGGK